MTTPGRTHERIVPRRRFLQQGAALAAGAGSTAIGSLATMNRSSIAAAHTSQIAGIDPGRIVAEMRDRQLDALSDTDLYRAVSQVVSRPPQHGMTSFTLHAPLEVMARYGLLRLVDPAERELARLQMVASGAVYASGVSSRPPPAPHAPLADLPTAIAEFSQRFEQADADGVESLVLQAAQQFGVLQVVRILAPFTLPTLTGASHSHIGLWLLSRHSEPTGTEEIALLRAGARALATDPKACMRSFSGMSIAGGAPWKRSASQVEGDIFGQLMAPPKGELRQQSIRSLVEAGEATGNADTLFGDFIRSELSGAQIDAAFRAILRVCALSMLQDDHKQAKFGWTHCLTLPQAACGLSGLHADRQLALAAALVWITAYRSVLSRRNLDPAWRPPALDESISIDEALHAAPETAASRCYHAEDADLPAVRRALATQASIRNDIHLVKYVRATLDATCFDPEYARLYLAAAAHLCALWMAETPKAAIRDHLLDGRSTPK